MKTLQKTKTSLEWQKPEKFVLKSQAEHADAQKEEIRVGKGT